MESPEGIKGIFAQRRAIDRVMLAHMQRFLTALTLSFGFVAVGCAGRPASPFDQMQNAPITVFRLQNYEPPPQAQASIPTQPGMIPGIPAEIQQWIQAGASMLPPGLLPPGLLPGQPPPPTPQADNAPRFYGFRILGQAPVTNEKLRDELISLFGHEKNFDGASSGCMYAELGVSFARLNQPPADILVSLSCDQVQAQNFQWPHRGRGLTPDTVKRLVNVSQSVFVGG